MTTKNKTTPVSKRRPCEVCGGDHKCSFAADGLILCGRKRGQVPGFIYLKQAAGDDQFAVYRREGDPVLAGRDRQWQAHHPPAPLTNGHAANGFADWPALAERFRQALTPALRDELAANLGLPANVLEALAVGWHGREKCWTFPERDAVGQVIGINRRWKDRAKKAMPNGHRGLSIPHDWRKLDGPILLPEGPSDVLALRAMNLCTIGRPSCTGGVDLLAGLLRDVSPDRPVVVLGENDPDPTKGLWPGRDGAMRTAEALSQRLSRMVSWCLPPDGAKDVRSWLTNLHLDLTCQDALEEAGERLLGHITTHMQGRLDPPPAESRAPEGCGPTRVAPRRIAPYVPFPVEALPPVASSFVCEAAAALGCDPGFLALPVLAVLASAIGNTRVIRLKRGWTEPAILWTAIVGDSGTLKSPAYFTCVGRLFATQEQLLAEHKRDAAAHQDELTRWKSARKDHEKGQGADPGDRPEPPQLRRVIVSDTTIEKLAEVLEDNRRGTLVARDELSGWLGSFTKYKGKLGGSDVPNWLELNRGGTLVVDRKTGERRTLFVKRAAASVTGGIQPGVLARALTHDLLDSGLAARLLLCWPPRQPKRWSEAEVHPDTEKEWSDLIDGLLALDFESTKDGQSVPHVLKLSEPAKTRWIEWYDTWAQEQAAVEGELAAAYSKLEGYAARFALLHHVVGHVVRQLARHKQTEEIPASGDDDAPVEAESIEAGIALSRWFAHEARRIYAALSETAEERDARRLIEFIRARGEQITVKELQRSNDRKYPTAEAAQSALQALADAGVAKWADRPSGPKGGRPTRSLTLHKAPDETDQTDETVPRTEAPTDETPGEPHEPREI